MTERLQEKYNKEIVPELLKELGIKNIMQAPRVLKISVNSGIGGFRDSKEQVDTFKEELTALLGQVPVTNPSKKAISVFKIRKGDIVGVSATLRGAKMWAFLDKLVNIILPRVRDFRGLSLTAFDSNGNYSIGLEDHTLFPEVSPNRVRASRGLQINIVTNSNNKEYSELLLRKLGFSFAKKN